MKIELSPEQIDIIFLSELKWLVENDPCVVHQDDIDAWEEMKGAAKVLLSYYDVDLINAS
jgi:hypothetical protein